MPRNISTYFLPALFEPAELSGASAIVIDVLRASTTIVHALAAGAERIVACLEIDAARHVAAQTPGTLLGGERGGVRIDGFDFGNSPAEYTADRVAGRSIAFTTSNGTRALLRCRQAAEVLIGGFVNRAAVCRAVSAAEHVAIVCAGTQGEVTREDVLAAGAIIDRLVEHRQGCRLNDQAQLALDAWHGVAAARPAETLAETLRATGGGRNLQRIGQDADIPLAAQLDQFALTPRRTGDDGGRIVVQAE